MGSGNPPSEPRGWQVSLRHPRDSRQTVQVVYLKNEFDVHFGKLRELLPRRGQGLQPHHGPPHRLSRAGNAVGFGDHAPDARLAKPGPSPTSSTVAIGPSNMNKKIFGSSSAKTDRNWHARGFNEQPLSRCLPPEADGRPSRLVHAAGGPISQAVSGNPCQARHSRDLQETGPGGRRHPATHRDPRRRCGHHLCRPAAAGRADGPETPVRRRRRSADRQSGAHLERRRFALHLEHRRPRLRRRGDPDRRRARSPAGSRSSALSAPRSRWRAT